MISGESAVKAMHVNISLMSNVKQMTNKIWLQGLMHVRGLGKVRESTFNS